MDVVEVPIPSLHFSQQCQGRLDDATIFFKGDFGNLERFVPVTQSLMRCPKGTPTTTTQYFWRQIITNNVTTTTI